jgi:hypothetical protein
MNIHTLTPASIKATSASLGGVIDYYYSSPTEKKRLEFPLTESDSQNFAYYISPDLKPISFIGDEVDSWEGVPEEEQQELIYEGGMKVSEVNNPFTFPLKLSYTVSGRGLNMASRALKISEEFGQYPLYVLTTEGVEIFQVGTDGVLYVTQAPITLEQPISDKILQTPYGVLFLTKKGLKMISGQGIEFVSEQLKLRKEEITFEKIDDISIGGAFKVNEEELLDYLSDPDLIMAYNPHEEEIIITTKTKDYSFVYSIPNGMWYLSTEKFSMVVEGSSPELYVGREEEVHGETFLNIIDYELEEPESLAEVALCLLPVTFETKQKKDLHRALLRARIYNGSNIFMMVHASIDDVTFKALKGIKYMPNNQLEEYNYVDFDPGLLAGKFVSFSVSFACTCKSNSKIGNVEFDIDQSYGNGKN